MTNYQKELVQVAAVAVAALQTSLAGSTELDAAGTAVHTKILDMIGDERRRQEAKFGTRLQTDVTGSPIFWFAVLGEEVGEVAREILEGRAA